MCFSATASFIASASLSALGVVTIKKAERKIEVPFAAIPLLFGIQQFTEGLIWLSFRFDIFWLNITMTFIYAFFAYVFSPIYLPFAVRPLEPLTWRKTLLFFFQLAGLPVRPYLLFFHVQVPVTSQITNKSIIYVASHFDIFWVMMFYFTATCMSALFSSHKLINIFGVLAFVFAIVSYQFYAESFVSVWCYFAAILSIIVYWHIKKQSVV